MRRKVNNSETHETKRYYEVPSEKVQEWSDTIANLTKQLDQYKAENEKLKEEVEHLKGIIKDEEDWKAIEQEYKDWSDDE